MAQPIDPSEVRRIARLARLELSEDEVQRFAGQLGDVLSHFAALQQIDTTDVEPLAHPLPLGNVVREDVPQPSLDAEAALRNAPAREGDHFRVPTVVDHGAA
jgi:aspartyl-tRNA(Asn)/glutamyl-tRNA(Gln) amidotransferase subunit C